MLIDTHCHLYLDEFKEDIDQVISAADEQGVEAFYLPGIDSNSIDAMLSLEEKFPGKCYAMMGLHPCYVNEEMDKELDQVFEWLSRRRFAAIGEIGLDFYHDTTFRRQQFIAFQKQIEWALEYDYSIVIHSRNAIRETIDIIKEYSGRGLKGIFHCFSGNATEAREIVNTGFYLGIGGVLTYKNSGLAQALEFINLDHLVLETDAPYLTPVPFRGKRNQSSYLPYVVEKLAELKQVTTAEVAAITTANAKKIFVR